MSKHQRILVGNGKYCYSGPSCSLHGINGSSSMRSEGQLLFHQQLQQQISQLFSAFDNNEKQYLCNTKNQASSISEAVEQLVRYQKNGRWCEEHNTYHLYSLKDFRHNVLRHQASEIMTTVRKAYKEAGNGFTDISATIKQSLEYEQTHRANSYLKDQEMLRSYDPVAYDKAKAFLEEERATQQAFSQAQVSRSENSRRKKRDEYSKNLAQKIKNDKLGFSLPYRLDKMPALLVPEENISDELMLEYWQCGRKQPYESFQAAQDYTSINNTGDDVVPYSCRSCGAYHNGHGDGKTSNQEQLRKARTHWGIFTDKANAFVQKKQLMSVT